MRKVRNSTKNKQIKMLSFEKLCNQSKFFARLTEIKLEQFHEIVRKVNPRWERVQKKKKVSGRPSKIKTLADGILLVSILCELSIFGDAV